MPREAFLDIGPITIAHHDGRVRVEVSLLGRPLWFETSDVALAPSMEGFATSILSSALFHRRRLRLTEPVCETWMNGVEQVASLLNSWWRFSKKTPVAERRQVPEVERSSGVGLLFTGGVDSFYSLFCFPRRIDHLIYMIDYDVTPDAPERTSTFEPILRELSRSIGVMPIVIRGNLRQHPAFAGPVWRQVFGSALIGAAHLLVDSIGEIIVSSSVSRYHAQPWGSHWELDRLWSSSRLKVSHFGEDCRRADKLQSIVDEELLHRFVRPCWENPPDRLNCSVCEKCLRSQVAIAACGDLSRFTAFDQSHSLSDRIDALRRIGSTELLPVWEDFLQLASLSNLHSAIEKLIRRSRFSMIRKTVRREIRRRLSFGRPYANI
jgi:hypothetical protein